MSDFDITKGLKIEQITSAAKLSSLFFSAIAFLQYYLTGKDVSDNLTGFFLVVIVVLVLLLGIFLLWNFLDKRSENKKFLITWVHPGVLITISFICIILTGAEQSNYKYLFLFVIISSSIDCGSRVGLTVAAISDIMVLGIDLVTGSGETVNSIFESDLVLAFAFLIIAWTIGFYARTEREHIETLKDLANIDGLTGLYNHRYFYDTLEESIKESKTNKKNLALLFIDIDNFKNYNDFNGHQKGDEVLRVISGMLKEIVKEDDIVARYGGEEFAIILPGTTEKGAVGVAEKLRHLVQEHYFLGQEYMPNKNLTISAGVSVFPSKAKSVVDLIKNADDALYRAKFLRKNRVEAYFSILDDLKDDVDENDKEIVASIKTLIAVINAKDRYTFSHVERVVSYCSIVADKLELNDSDRKNFIYAAYMHDIGKINIAEEILIKNKPLTAGEWEILKGHPRNAAEIIRNVIVLKDVVPIIEQHHERYDGTGYPDGLKGTEILYLARLLTIVDSFDAMTSDRPYKARKNFAEAFDELVDNSGTQFDPEMVPVFIDTIKEYILK